jgi:MFS family permease
VRNGAGTDDRLRAARRSLVATFVLHAATAGTLGPRLPAIKDQAELSSGQLGIALTGFAVGLFAGARLAPLPVRRLGTRSVMRYTVPALAATLVGPALAQNLVGLTLALALLGAATGLLDVAMNANAVVVERGYRRPIMSSIHGAWSVGLLGSSLLSAGAVALGASPLVHFGAVAVAIAVLGLPLLGGVLQSGNEPRIRPMDTPRSHAVPPVAVLLLGLIGFSSFLGEGAASDWSAIYAKETLGASATAATFAFVGFALGMTLARFVGDRLNAKVGPVLLVRAGGLVGAGGLAFALAVAEPPAAIVGFTIFGLAVAPVVPLTFSAAGNLHAGAEAAPLGWVVTISYLGAILGPAAIGFVAHLVGLRGALVVPVVLSLAIAALAGRLRT